MIVNINDKNIMEIGNIKPGQVIKAANGFYIVTTKVENGATTCVNLVTGGFEYFYADDTAILYSSANLNLQ